MIDKRITIIGAGNGGQAIAGLCGSLGYEVCMYNRSVNRLERLNDKMQIQLQGAVSAVGGISLMTDSIETAVNFSKLIFIVTPATAHKSLANLMAPFLKEGHIVVLNPGRSFGAMEFETELKKNNHKKIHIAETQTLIYACRIIEEGNVHVIGVKKHVPVSASFDSDIDYVLENIKRVSTSFERASSSLQLAFDNIGSILHPAIVMFNAATIERNDTFYFYRDMTPKISEFIIKLDNERLRIGKAYGIDLMSVSDWICHAYPETTGNSLCERMKNNPAYHDIKAPGSIFARQLTEDIPTGLVPMSEIARVAGVEVPIMDSLITMTSELLNIDFRHSGRNLSNLGLDGMDVNTIKNLFK